MLPEVGHGVIPDTGGVGRLYQMCGHGVRQRHGAHRPAPDAPTRRSRHGIVSRVVPADELDATAREMAEKIAAAPAVTVKMARRVIAPPGRARDPLVDGGRADRTRPSSTSPTTSPSSGPPAPRSARPALHGELTVHRAPTRACPSRPTSGATALPAGTFDGDRRRSSPAAGTGLGKAIAIEFARLGAVDRHRQPQARAPRGRARRRSTALGAPVRHRRPATSATPSRSPPRSTPPSRALGLPRRADQQRGGQLPRARPRTCRPTRGAPSSTSRSTARSSAPASSPAATSPPARPARSSNVGASYAWTGGPGFAHSAAAKAGVKNMVETLAVEWGPYGIQVNGLVPGLFPHEDMTADIQGNLDRTDDKDRVPAGAAGRAAARARAGRRRSWPRPTPGSSPATRSWSTAPTGSAARLTNPPVVTVRDQMGKGPFSP